MTTVFKEVTVAVEWTITIEGKNEFGDVCRREVRIDKSWERPFDGEIGVDVTARGEAFATAKELSVRT